MDIAFASTIDLATAIAARRISAVVALDAHLAQIDRGNGAVNAIVTLDREGARERARQADVALARGDALGPLHGVPFTLKDTHDTAGMKTTVGFLPFADYVAKKDSPVVARLKAAGAILIGKTNVATMLSDWQSDNPLFGRTGNPWNLSRTAGGSSGGAAAAVAAGMTPFEIGTDMQDSIRLPAAFCGVYGLKPTEHRVSLAGAFPDPGGTARSVRLMSCLGPLARSAEDLALIYRIIAGPDEGDTDLAPVPVEATETPDVSSLRITVATSFPGFPVAGEITAAVEKLGEKLGSAGAMVEEAKLPRLDLHDDLAEGGALIGMMLEAAQPDPPDQPTPVSRWFAALARRDRSILAWDRFFESCDALLCPVAMTTAFPHCAPGTAIEVNGREESYWMLPAYGA
ncbi:amidase, partial [Mesorhizobium sp. M4A.F.Ca.ET.029.04.2.1]